jgi:hypothetical protein
MYTNTWLEFMLHITIHHDKENETCAGIKCKSQHPECKPPIKNDSDGIRIEIFIKSTDLFM